MMTLDWERIAEAARALGVSPEALKKWRQRGSVPHRWRLPLIKEANLPVDAFEDERDDARV